MSIPAVRLADGFTQHGYTHRPFYRAVEWTVMFPSAARERLRGTGGSTHGPAGAGSTTRGVTGTVVSTACELST